MWVFLNNSFLSIVENRNNKDELLVRSRIKGDVESQPIPFKFNDPEKKFIFKKDKFRENFIHKFTEKSDLDYIIYCLKQKYESMK